MRTIVHLSDVHFGRVNEQVIAPLIDAVNGLAPNVVAVSGDLTQRARSHQFEEARAFLDQLPQPQIVVPGNHDVPLHNVPARFFQPLEKYRRYITDDLQPFYQDDEIAVLGINTARSLTIKGGRVNQRQVHTIQDRFCSLDKNIVRIVVTHHPFDLPAGQSKRNLVGRARMAMEALASCGADVFLAGHLHVSQTTHSASRYKIAGHSALVVQAGTATSSRGRGEANSFNVVRVDQSLITVERFEWLEDRGEFSPVVLEQFNRTPAGWMRQSS
ncbi:MAG TPA: metallophosphoesterase family protein [Pyrinomonadaceae bacterium]|nr:metallophosphoesterase family protein [Pyrinomonadaceae bacterium]